MKILIFLFYFMTLGLMSLAYSAEYLINLPPKNEEPESRAEEKFAPGAIVQLPDGRQAIIENSLSNGDLQTNLGIVISPEGIVRNEPGQPVVILVAPPSSHKGLSVTENPQGVPDSQTSEKPIVMVPPVTEPERQSISKPELPTAPDEKNAQVNPSIQKAVEPEIQKQPEDSEQLTLAQMLPLTQTKKPESKPETTQKPEHKQLPKTQKEQPKKEVPVKPKAGQELRIPPEAAKTGNLDFLEGCWQGTRPEYYSKRTIKECFCFGAAGKNGKRRVIDPLGHRMCIGSSSARLSSNGVLSVTSQGAACDDGERWGSAEMICQNSGPKTPCSWVFHDANNGRQSYSIPFVRVDSCGR